MKCPNCGAEMKKDALYCEQCGEDIHIVPDFEPELDDDIQQTIKSIADDIWEQDDSKERLSAETQKPQSKRASYRKWIIFAVVLVVFLSLGVAGGVSTYLYFSVEYQTDRARECVEDGLYDRAVRHYTRAIELDESNVNLKVELAEVYFLKNNKIEYEYLLRQIAMDENATAEQVESAYGKLIAIYRARGDYQTINDFLLASENENVLAIYQNYVATAPEFSVKAGNYNSIQPLKLTASGSGRIYYTLDGSDPDENSTLYTTPILLERGDYLIKAYFVNENGIASDIAAAEYHIIIEKLPDPEISVVSGDYNIPMDIAVINVVADIYYTTDGSDPNVTSTPYTGPLHMPLGESVFRFICIEDGRTSDVVERTYRLNLNTNVSTADAEGIVVAYRMRTGRILDEAGHFDTGNGDMYKYQYQYVTNINGVGDYYVIAEILRSKDGTSTRTGSYYAVGAYGGELFRLQIDNNNYTLVVIEETQE